jgi:hypothetical protein
MGEVDRIKFCETCGKDTMHICSGSGKNCDCYECLDKADKEYTKKYGENCGVCGKAIKDKTNWNLEFKICMKCYEKIGDDFVDKHRDYVETIIREDTENPFQ